MRKDERALNDLLIRWHRWTAAPAIAAGTLMSAFDMLVATLEPGLRAALIVDARNLSCGAAVWSSTRVRSRETRRLARAAIMRLLAKDQARWFGTQVVHLNERGNRIGESNPMAKISDHDLSLLLQHRDDGRSLGWIAAKMGLPKSTVQDYCSGRRRSQTVARVKVETT